MPDFYSNPKHSAFAENGDISRKKDEFFQDFGTDARARLIEATIESIYHNGISDTTVAKIGQIAEMSTANIHHHFATKEGLLVQVMSHLLEKMRSGVVADCALAETPRGKLNAVISSVLGDEQSDERVIAVWLSFWRYADKNEDMRRLRNLYSVRLNSNVSAYLTRIFRETGAPDARVRARYAAVGLVAMMHGAWLSFTQRENSMGLADARMLALDYLDMLIGRAREPIEVGAPDEAMISAVATTASLFSDLSFEVVGKDIDNIAQWRAFAADGAMVFIPHFPDREWARAFSQATTLRASGLRPVAHLAARNFSDASELRHAVDGFVAAGARDFLVLGGGEDKPAGDFDSATAILESGALARADIDSVGFAGHPEGHPRVDAKTIRAALLAKCDWARARGISVFVATQFCFATEPLIDFLNFLDRNEIRAPVRLGVAGRVNAAKLLKYSIACGVGNSLGFLKRSFGKTMGLMRYSPDALLAETAARVAARHYSFPVEAHFYPFGAIRETLLFAAAAGFSQARAAKTAAAA